MTVHVSTLLYHLVPSNLPPPVFINIISLFLVNLIVYNSHRTLHFPLSSISNLSFSDYIQNTFAFHTLIFTNGSVWPLSAGYAFYLSQLHISFSNNFPS